LDRDDFTEGLALWSSEGHLDGVDGVVGLDVRKDGQWNGDSAGLLALDFLFNRNVDDLNWALGEFLLFVHGEGAALFPWPEGVVQDCDVFDKAGAWAGLEDDVSFLLEHGSLGIPRVVHVFAIRAGCLPVGLLAHGIAHFSGVLLHVLTKLLHHLTHLFELLLLLFFGSVLHGVAEVVLHLLAFGFATAFLHELFHHAHETATGTHTATATSTTTPSVATSTTAILTFSVVFEAKVRHAVSFVLSCSLELLLLLSFEVTHELILEVIEALL